MPTTALFLRHPEALIYPVLQAEWTRVDMSNFQVVCSRLNARLRHPERPPTISPATFSCAMPLQCWMVALHVITNLGQLSRIRSSRQYSGVSVARSPMMAIVTRTQAHSISDKRMMKSHSSTSAFLQHQSADARRSIEHDC